MRTKFLHLLAVALPVLLGCQLVAAQKRPSNKRKSAQKVTQSTVIKADLTPRLITDREQQLLDEINQVRANPIQYVSFLQQYRTLYREKVIHFPDGRTLVTNEGVAPLDEAIKFIRTLKPLPPLSLSKGMLLGAKSHLEDMLKSGRSGHTGSDGSKPEDRLSRYGSWRDAVGENIVYDSRTARYDLLGLLVDDGVATRGHRNNLFKPTFSVIGIAIGQPTKAPTICVITFAGGFTDRSNRSAPAATKY